MSSNTVTWSVPSDWKKFTVDIKYPAPPPDPIADCHSLADLVAVALAMPWHRRLLYDLWSGRYKSVLLVMDRRDQLRNWLIALHGDLPSHAGRSGMRMDCGNGVTLHGVVTTNISALRGTRYDRIYAVESWFSNKELDTLRAMAPPGAMHHVPEIPF